MSVEMTGKQMDEERERESDGGEKSVSFRLGRGRADRIELKQTRD